jgi:hypothetical protein
MTGHETMDQLGFAPSAVLTVGSEGSQRPPPPAGDGSVSDPRDSVAGSADGVMQSEGEADERLSFDHRMALLNTESQIRTSLVMLAKLCHTMSCCPETPWRC